MSDDAKDAREMAKVVMVRHHADSPCGPHCIESAFDEGWDAAMEFSRRLSEGTL